MLEAMEDMRYLLRSGGFAFGGCALYAGGAGGDALRATLYAGRAGRDAPLATLFD